MSNSDLVIGFLHAWDECDFDAAFSMISDDIVYKNSGYPDAFGHEGVRTMLATLIAGTTTLLSKIHAIAENADGVVMTERTDTMNMPNGTIHLPVMGVFDVKDGKITGWRDYFDASPFKQK